MTGRQSRRQRHMIVGYVDMSGERLSCLRPKSRLVLTSGKLALVEILDDATP